MADQKKIKFEGKVRSVQPRSNVWRYRLDMYDWRGCRMLDGRTYKGKCFPCKWACMANVAIEYDWGVSQKFRFESFCYGPKNCKLYKMGKPRAVPYKGDQPSYDEGWLDDICTERREDEE